MTASSEPDRSPYSEERGKEKNNWEKKKIKITKTFRKETTFLGEL